MSYIEGFDRKQAVLFPPAIDSMIGADNEIRFIDLFVDKLDLGAMGFQLRSSGANGRPSYRPSDLLKLYIYGYLNRIRSSRALERECGRNIELMWLLRGLVPDHNTISNFRRDHGKQIKRVFRETVKTAAQLDLIGGTLLAIDGTRVRAQNSKKNNYTQKKIDRHLEYIEKKLSEYTQALANADGDEKKELEAKIAEKQARKKEYKGLEKQLEESGQTQISTSDPDSRNLMIRKGHSEVSYNVQSTVDSKHNIPIDYKLTNSNDRHEMYCMTRRASVVLGRTSFTALFDKGYHTGSELEKCRQLGVEVLASPPLPSSGANGREGFRVSDMEYDKESDSYTCPAGEKLTTNGKYYNKDKSGKNRSKQYKTKACENCQLREQCTKSERGRVLERTEFADAIERNAKLVEENKELYRQRQQIVEHPFGTMKRQWGFDHIMTKKGNARASADVGLVFIAYNLRRLLSIVGISGLKGLLEGISRHFVGFRAHIGLISRFSALLLLTSLSPTIFAKPRKKAYIRSY